jgi:hypothetical protein
MTSFTVDAHEDCATCGAVVANTERHVRWHKALAHTVGELRAPGQLAGTEITPGECTSTFPGTDTVFCELARGHTTPHRNTSGGGSTQTWTGNPNGIPAAAPKRETVTLELDKANVAELTGATLTFINEGDSLHAANELLKRWFACATVPAIAPPAIEGGDVLELDTIATIAVLRKTAALHPQDPAYLATLLERWLERAKALRVPPPPPEEPAWEQLGKANKSSYVYQDRHEWKAQLGAKGKIAAEVRNELPVFLRGRTYANGTRQYQLVQRPADAPEDLFVSDANMVVVKDVRFP